MCIYIYIYRYTSWPTQEKKEGKAVRSSMKGRRPVQVLASSFSSAKMPVVEADFVPRVATRYAFWGAESLFFEGDRGNGQMHNQEGEEMEGTGD